MQKSSHASSPRIPAVAYCQGTLLRNEIVARDAGKLESATEYGGRTVRVSVPQPAANARRDQLIDALEELREASKQRYGQVGYTAAEAHSRQVMNEQSAIHEAIMAERATTMDGLMVKARAIKSLYPEEDEIELGDTTDMQLMASLVNVMLRGQITT